MATEMFLMEDIAMSRKHFSRHNKPLDSDDLRKCQAVLDAICGESEIEPGSEEEGRVAAIIIQLYQQDVHDLGQLKHLIDAARGLARSRHRTTA